MMAFSSTNLHWLTRKAPFVKQNYFDQDIEIDFEQCTTPTDVVSVIATQPLTVMKTGSELTQVISSYSYLGERIL
ncbi:class II glutamine amidotransferase [Providencia rettgeri]|uniref:Class II glutamine amidotransferase n=1 Tax=Providencia rettgeri TaxID=587 RepID=A0A939SJF9_PRORE|nr:class II glutamine amidotransferase [Providencia rettgeri]